MLVAKADVKVSAGEMIDDIDAFHKFFDSLSVRDVAAHRLQIGIHRLMPQQVKLEIDRAPIMSLLELAIHQVTSDESACASDENPHAVSGLTAVTMTALLVF